MSGADKFRRFEIFFILVVIVPVPILGAIKNVPSIPRCRSKDKSPFGPPSDSTRGHRLLHQGVDSRPPSDLKDFYARGGYHIEYL